MRHRTVMALLMLCTAPALAGDREEVQAAYTKLLAVKSYHATMTHAGKRPMVNELDFVAPDRIRVKMDAGTQVIIGDTLYMSIDGNSMRIPMPKGLITQYRDPAKLNDLQAPITWTGCSDDTLDGQKARKCTWTDARTKGAAMAMWIGSNGLPAQMHVTGKTMGMKTDTLIRYTRFNDPSIRIDSPK